MGLPETNAARPQIILGGRQDAKNLPFSWAWREKGHGLIWVRNGEVSSDVCSCLCQAELLFFLSFFDCTCWVSKLDYIQCLWGKNPITVNK